MEFSIEWIVLMSCWAVLMLVWAYAGPLRKEWGKAIVCAAIALCCAVAALFVN